MEAECRKWDYLYLCLLLVFFFSFSFRWFAYATFLFFFLSFSLLFSFLFLLFKATPVAHGSSQARGRVGTVATSLRYSHSYASSDLCLWPTPQLTATPDPQPTERGQGLNLHLVDISRVLNPLSHSGNSLHMLHFLSETVLSETNCLSVRILRHFQVNFKDCGNPIDQI